MKQYHNLLEKILSEGILQNNRTGIPCYSVVGEMLSFDMNDGFPAITTKKLAFNQVKGELIGFIRGCTNVKDFQALGCTVWNLNANADYWINNPTNKGNGDLGCIYGSQWRNYNGEGIDQLSNAISEIISNPTSRRIKVEAWNPSKLSNMALPPCHTGFQLYVNTKDNELSMTMNQRSCDMFLGVPFNIASYALLLHLIAECTGYKPRYLKMFLTDCHIYENHVEQVKMQLARQEYDLPSIEIPKFNIKFDLDPMTWLENIQPDDINLIGYECYSTIKASMAV